MWTSFGKYYLTENLKFTQPFDSQLIRIKQSKPIYPDELQGVIYQGFKDSRGNPNLFGEQQFKYSKDPLILTFYFPQELKQRSLVFTRTDKSKTIWSIDVEIYQPDESNVAPPLGLDEEKLANYLADYLIPKFPTFNMKQNLIPKSQSIRLKPGFTAQPLVAANPNRVYLEFRAGGSPVYIWADEVDENGVFQVILAEIPKGETYPLPVVSDGIYKGAVYAQVAKRVDVDWTEYSYPGTT